MISRLFAVSALSALGLVSHAIVFTGVDEGVDSTGPRPNTNQAAANFVTYAGNLNSISAITFEDQAIGEGMSYDLGKGVSVDISDAYPTVGSFYTGISTLDSSIFGFNTTYGGRKFLNVLPTLDEITTVHFHFTEAINSFGFNWTAMEDEGATFDVVYDYNGEVRHRFSGTDLGGVRFVGFVEEQAALHDVRLEIRTGNSFADFTGIDDLLFTHCDPVPEPATLGVLGLGLLAGLRKKRNG